VTTINFKIITRW